jgi:hypothetical protein
VNKQEENMVARLIPTQEPLKLTQANHPENAVQPEKPITLTLGSSIAACIISGLVGMTFGCGALSTAFLVDAPGHIASLLPLVATGVCFLGAWIGAFFWMCREEAANRKP